MNYFRVILTVADHEKNGFIALSRSNLLSEADARRVISATDALVDDDAEPDNKTAPYTFILDLMGPNHTLVDNSNRLLPTQIAMSLAPDEVRQWLDERPDPDATYFLTPPTSLRIGRAA